MTAQRYYAPGKLLLTSEYAVLDGALALALPLRLGQDMVVTATAEHRSLHWQSYRRDGSCWLDVQFDPFTLQVLHEDVSGPVERLQSILQHIKQLAPDVPWAEGTRVQTHLEFDQSWGLGSSSTLLVNLAKWAHISVYALADRTFGGSGYDLACGLADGPIIYQRREGSGHFLRCPFDPGFKEHLYFAYLGQKQDSREGIRHFRQRGIQPPVDTLSMLTLELAHTTSWERFCDLLRQHEALISAVLGIRPLGQTHFSSFPGTVKSLGAWGGDFILLASKQPEYAVRHYLKDRGISTLISYEDWVLGPFGKN